MILCSENKCADQLCNDLAADLHSCFQICDEQVSHDAADMMKLDYFCLEDKTLSLIDNFLVIASPHWISGNPECSVFNKF